jgi:hypothetical protein
VNRAISVGVLNLVLLAASHANADSILPFQATPADGITLVSGNVFAVTGFAGTSAAVGLFDTSTQMFTLLASGGSFSTAHLTGIARGQDGTLYVAEFGNRRGGGQQVVAVAPDGSRRVVADMGSGVSGTTQITDLTVAGDGSIVVSVGGQLIRIDPTTGAQSTILSRDARYSSVDTHANGMFVVGCESTDAPCNGRGVLVQQTSFDGTVVSSDGLFANPRGLSLFGNTAYVLNQDSLFGSSVFSIDLLTGQQRQLSHGGLLGPLVGGIALGSDGTVFVISGTGLIRVDPNDGTQTFLTFGTSPTSPPATNVPEPSAVVMLTAGLLLVSLEKRRSWFGDALSALEL